MKMIQTLKSEVKRMLIASVETQKMSLSFGLMSDV